VLRLPDPPGVPPLLATTAPEPQLGEEIAEPVVESVPPEAYEPAPVVPLEPPDPIEVPAEPIVVPLEPPDPVVIVPLTPPDPVVVVPLEPPDPIETAPPKPKRPARAKSPAKAKTTGKAKSATQDQAPGKAKSSPKSEKPTKAETPAKAKPPAKATASKGSTAAEAKTPKKKGPAAAKTGSKPKAEPKPPVVVDAETPDEVLAELEPTPEETSRDADLPDGEATPINETTPAEDSVADDLDLPPDEDTLEEPPSDSEPYLLPIDDLEDDEVVIQIRSSRLRMIGRLVAVAVVSAGLIFTGYTGYQAWTEGTEGIPAVFIEPEPTPSPINTEDLGKSFPGYVSLVITEEDGSWTQPALVIDKAGQAVVRYDWIAEAVSLAVQYGADDSVQARLVGYNETWNVALLDIGVDPRIAEPPSPADWVRPTSGAVKTVGESPTLGEISETEVSVQPCFGRTRTVCGKKKLFSLIAIAADNADDLVDPVVDDDGNTIALIIGRSEDATHVYGLGQDQLAKVVERILSTE
jgi:hypothetical protein